MATVSVSICFRELLRNVCERLSLAAPIYGDTEQNAEGLVRIPVYIEFFDEEAEFQSFRCWGGPCTSADQAEENAAQRALSKLHDELPFEVQDFHFEEKKYYENLYNRVSKDHTVLRKKYKKLRSDYNILRRSYIDLLTEKRRDIVDYQKVHATTSREIPGVPPGFGI